MPDNDINSQIIEKINQSLSHNYSDYQGLYFYGSRRDGNSHNNSDLDIVIVFDDLSYEKKLSVAGIIGDVEYQYNIIIDFKLFTLTGKRGIDTIRNNINPYFIHKAVDTGLFYGRV